MRVEGKFPEFSWSHSRDRTLAECTRAYYWRYYGSHRGWQPGAENEVRLAYALKQLTSFPMLVGGTVHACARDCANAVRRGKRRPPFEAMLARVSDALNRAVIGSHHRGLFQRDPKRVVMLHDAWYSRSGRGADLVTAVAKARICLRNLEASPVWEDVERCRPEWITVPNGAEAFVHDGWPIYAEPDLVYRPDERSVVIVDWKTGDDTDAELQILLYTLYCRTVLGLPFRDKAWFGRVVNLATGTDSTFEISRYDVIQTAKRIRESVQTMQTLLAVPDRNEPRPITDFPLPDLERRHNCPYCPFYALCQTELETADLDERGDS